MLLIDLDETLIHSVALELDEVPTENFSFLLDVSTIEGVITDVTILILIFSLEIWSENSSILS